MNKTGRDALPFILPLLFFITIFIFLPVIGTFWNSLWQDVAFIPKKFIGIANYSRLFLDNKFWQSTLFTLIFPGFSVLLEMIFGMFIALTLNEALKFRGLLRGIAIIPWAIPTVIGARIWQLIYRYDYGLANYLLGIIGITRINWLGTPAGAFFCLVLADVWRTTPFVAIILLAGLQVIPNELYEQAKVDGAGPVRRFFYITLPLLRPIIIVALIFRTIDALRVFDLIYVITGGGPGGATTSLSVYGYRFFLSGDFGYGSAISVILFLFALIIALLFIKIGRFQKVSI